MRKLKSDEAAKVVEAKKESTVRKRAAPPANNRSELGLEDLVMVAQSWSFRIRLYQGCRVGWMVKGAIPSLKLTLSKNERDDEAIW